MATKYMHLYSTTAYPTPWKSEKPVLETESPDSFGAAHPSNSTLTYSRTMTKPYYSSQPGRQARRRNTLRNTTHEQKPVYTVVVTRTRTSSTMGETMSNLRPTGTNTYQSIAPSGFDFAESSASALILSPETVSANNNGSKHNTTRVTILNDTAEQINDSLLRLQRFKLRTQLLYGDARFDNLTVQDPIHRKLQACPEARVQYINLWLSGPNLNTSSVQQYQ